MVCSQRACGKPQTRWGRTGFLVSMDTGHIKREETVNLFIMFINESLLLCLFQDLSPNSTPPPFNTPTFKVCCSNNTLITHLLTLLDHPSCLQTRLCCHMLSWIREDPKVSRKSRNVRLKFGEWAQYIYNKRNSCAKLKGKVNTFPFRSWSLCIYNFSQIQSYIWDLWVLWDLH